MRRGLAVVCAVAALLAAAVPAKADPCGPGPDPVPDGHVTVAPPAGLNPEDIRGIAGTAPGDTPSVTVSVYPGSDAMGDVQASQNVGLVAGRFCLPTPALPDGTWTVQAVQTDADHHVWTSAPRSFQVDHSGPQVTLTEPGEFTGDALPEFAGAAGTEQGDLSAVTITVKTPAGEIEIPASARGGEVRASAPDPLPDGRYTAVATQRDELGNVGRSAVLTFTVDTVKPTMTLTAPTGEWTQTVSVAGTASVGAGDEPSVLIELRQGDARIRTVSAAVVNGAFAAVVPGLPDGAYDLIVTHSDRALNSVSARRTVRIDTTPPAVNTGGVRTAYTLGERAAPVFSCADAGVGVASCEGPASVDTSALGTHAMTITARDALGNARSVQVRYGVVAAPRRSAPGLAIRSAKLSRHGRTVTLKVRGGAAKGATGKVTVSVGTTKRTAKLSGGKWSTALKLKTRKRKLKLAASYSGDAAYAAATVTRTVK